MVAPIFIYKSFVSDCH